MILPFLSRRLLLVSVTLLLLSACETSKPGRGGFPEVSTSTDPEDVRKRRLEATSTQVGRVSEGKIEYLVPRSQLAQNFIRQFSDGTVIDKTIIRKVQGSTKEKAGYYLVGLGMYNGSYRAMALPLQISSDQSLYLTSDAERYIVTSVGCQFCYFSFEKSAITGTACEDNTAGNHCDMTVENGNTFFARK